MVDWTDTSDDGMRATVLRGLEHSRNRLLKTAGDEDAAAGDVRRSEQNRELSADVARHARRQATHYQQAIDLLTKAPMPEVSDGAR